MDEHRGDRDKGDSYNRDRNVDRSHRSYNNRDSHRDGQRDDRRDNRDHRDHRDSRDNPRDSNRGPPRRQQPSTPEDGEARMPKFQPDVKPVSVGLQRLASNVSVEHNR